MSDGYTTEASMSTRGWAVTAISSSIALGYSVWTGNAVLAFGNGFLAFAGFTGVASGLSPEFGRWAERHSLVEKVAIVALFVVLAYLIWEDAQPPSSPPGALAVFYWW
ncbi:hypothetical protein [Natrarchaeobius chitinivorans]|uniref:Uncharacterized protein n=1 Tax=Natrarchaeobius chitinivorans TaxID=1679083 RepID=A0A3N6M061_NATCH|nr:hypothetical protein [Natrarchaeobius chitinivorans]RQG96603.1 hypothetical protein EA473_05700 [Natrarchaeobius chitinivorans]